VLFSPLLFGTRGSDGKKEEKEKERIWSLNFEFLGERSSKYVA